MIVVMGRLWKNDQERISISWPRTLEAGLIWVAILYEFLILKWVIILIDEDEG